VPSYGVDSARSLAPDHPALHVRKVLGRTTKRRALTGLTGMSPGNVYCAYNNTIDGMERAVKERKNFTTQFRDGGKGKTGQVNLELN